MGLSDERRILQDGLRRATREPAPPRRWAPIEFALRSSTSRNRYASVVATVTEHLAGLEADTDPDGRPDNPVEKLRIEVSEYDEDGLTGREFELRASGSVRQKRYRASFAGTGDVTTAQLIPGTIQVWPVPEADEPDEPWWEARPVADEPDATLVEAPGGSDATSLRRWAVAVPIALVLMSIGGAVAVWLGARDVFDRPTTDVPEMLVLAAAVGWVGSCLAAIRSYIDRSAEGVEYDRRVDHVGDDLDVVRRAQWPKRPPKTQRFNSNVARGMLLRPLLGALTAPIAYFASFVLAAGVRVEMPASTPDRDVGFALIGIAGLAGLFAKTMLDNLNESTTNLFKPHGQAS